MLQADTSDYESIGTFPEPKNNAESKNKKRIGAAEGKFSVPEMFDSEKWNREIALIFEKDD